ncbi:MAG: hypothetical protein KDI42_07005 [Gammaproteobacteria bacterium]|nr:hypothetical protein [Gammaproteobacteria bacterium]
MSNLLVVLMDGNPELEFDRTKPLEEHQALYLDKMDEKMGAGIDIAGEFIIEPASGQRAQFVAAQLATALKTGNEQMAAAMCSYLAARQVDLKQVKITNEDGGLAIDLDYENDYVKAQPVVFHPRKPH